MGRTGGAGLRACPEDLMGKSHKNQELFIYKRQLPHWRMSGSVYFVTWRLYRDQPELNPHERDIIASSLKYFDKQRYDLFAFVVMLDHVHVLVKLRNGFLLNQIVHTWKSYSAYKLQRDFSRSNRIWQDEYFDRIVRDQDELYEKAQYILNNPLKIMPEIHDYRWVWIRDLAEAGTEARPTEGNSP
jgi:putative transposase